MKKTIIIILLLVLVAAFAAPKVLERAAAGESLGDMAQSVGEALEDKGGELGGVVENVRETLGDKGGRLFSWVKDYFASHESGEIAEHLHNIFQETASLTDEELDAEIRAAAEGVSLSLTDGQVAWLRSLCRKYEHSDESEIRQSVEEWKEKLPSLSDMGDLADSLKDITNEAGSIWDANKGVTQNLQDIFQGFIGTGE